MDKLTGKVVLITGASRGIGRSIAVELSKRGATVAINYSKDEEGAAATLAEIEALGGYAKVFKKNISLYNQCNELIEEVVNTFGKIDILINNAGKSHIGLFMDTKAEELLDIININLMGTIYLSKLVIPHMASKREGNIVNISSIWGEAGASCEVIYSTSKGGINTFTKALAKEVAPFGIRVNAIAPGVINTEMNSFLDDEEKQMLIDEIPQGRFGATEEVAKLVAFLCDDGCKYLTGQIIKVDGGMI